MSKKTRQDGRKVVAQNKKAFFNYHIHERVEAGIVLLGSEVKSLRNGKAQMADSYARLQGEEIWLLNLHISEYSHAALQNHLAMRPRKLLLHKREIGKLKVQLEQKGYTVVPLSLYFRRGLAKVELGLATGKKLHDKRQDLKRKEANREIQKAMRGRE